MNPMNTPYRPPMPYRLPWQMPVGKLPSAAQHAGQKIWVTDLHEGLAGYCASDGLAWIPDRSTAIATRSAVTAIQLKALVHRPIQRFTGSIPVGGLAVTFDTVGAWNGLTWRIIRVGGGLGALNLLGKILNVGQAVEVGFDGTTFVQLTAITLL